MAPLDPCYLALTTAELRRRAEAAQELLGDRCQVCPRECSVDRRRDEHGLCGIGRRAVVSSAFPHVGEEDCLRGWQGSGTIFFSGCNMRCVFCQNNDISWRVHGRETSAKELASIMLDLQQLGCHNVNWVTPEHVVPQILEALPHAVEGGLRVPIVYNTGAYDSLDSLRLLDGIVDVYMPDLKLWSRGPSRRYLQRREYPNVARDAVREMHRQVGPLQFDAQGMALRGLLVRHLVMPGMIEETRAILRFLAEEIGPGTYVNVMAQYHPAGRVGDAGRYAEIDRPITRDEHAEAVALAGELGLRLDERWQRQRARSRGRGRSGPLRR